MIYERNKLREISFPLGGIGTGCIGLSGNGRLIDWEIFNRPNKGSANGFSHFAIKAETEDKVLDARVLNGDLQPPYIGNYSKEHFNCYGFGPGRDSMAGMPHFRDVEFDGEYPFARLLFKDESNSFPANVVMTAFNPFIPLNDKDSSIPGAFFEIEIENITEEELFYTLCFSLSNPFKAGQSYNRFSQDKGIHFITLGNSALKEDDLDFGNMTVSTDAEDVSIQEYWYRGAWFDNLDIYWDDFTKFGKFNNRTYAKSDLNGKVSGDYHDVCSLAARTGLSAGQKKRLRFLITWHFPNCVNYWNSPQCCEKDCDCGESGWKNYYSRLFESSIESSLYGLENWDRLYGQTLEFKEALFSSTLPEKVLDAISANISILKTPTCLRLEDGSFYGFEGTHCDCGCCEGSCTHVWNYAYALPFLFPGLERTMRDLDFKCNQREDGGMSFRLQLPLGRERSKFRPCADGQFGGVIKTYRDWKISGDTQWLRSNWDAVKKSIEFAWADTNEDKWDLDKDGVLEGRQHHTLDMELFGPNSWLTGFYLAALKAGAEMAGFLGEKGKEQEYGELFKRGKEWADQNLFNGEYYFQDINLKDKSILEKFKDGATLIEKTTIDAYWNDEAKEIKYQIGEGCIVDQVIAQWHANICGLGEIFDKDQTRAALTAIYKNNFKDSMRKLCNPCRIFALNDEAALIICDWPEEVRKPINPIVYAQEAMCGFEYQVAAHMIQEGLLQEGLELVKAVRCRYDGEKRNPWNEIECGSNYARSMASYSLLLAYSGFEFNMADGMLGFNPKNFVEGCFKCLWSLDSGWGVFTAGPGLAEVSVLHGSLKLKKIKLLFIDRECAKTAHSGNAVIMFHSEGDEVIFEDLITISKNNALTISFYNIN